MKQLTQHNKILIFQGITAFFCNFVEKSLELYRLVSDRLGSSHNITKVVKTVMFEYGNLPYIATSYHSKTEISYT
mgnify:CR=1 FL=1